MNWIGEPEPEEDQPKVMSRCFEVLAQIKDTEHAEDRATWLVWYKAALIERITRFPL